MHVMQWRLLLRARFIAIPVALFAATAIAMPSTDADGTLRLGQCAEHLQALVSLSQTNAQKKGSPILVEWNTDGSVNLRYEHFAQRMRCEHGVLLVDYPGFVPLSKEAVRP